MVAVRLCCCSIVSTIHNHSVILARRLRVPNVCSISARPVALVLRRYAPGAGLSNAHISRPQIEARAASRVKTNEVFTLPRPQLINRANVWKKA